VGALLILSRLALAVVFAVAGVAKLASMSRTREAVLDFGAPHLLATPLAVALVAAELAAAAALTAPATAWYGAVGALGLSLVFATAIAGNLLHGRRPNCNCFGQVRATPVSWSTFARAIGLAALALFVVTNVRDAAVSMAVLPTLAPRDWILLAVSLLGAGLLAVVAAMLGQVLRQQGRMLLRFDAIEERLGMRAPRALPEGAGIAPESEAPEFSLPDLTNVARTLEDVRSAGRPVLMVFTHPGCGPCQSLMPDLESWQKELRESLTVAVISEGSPADNEKYAARLDPKLVLLQQRREVAQLYEVYGTPAALVVMADGRIATYQAQGPEEVRSLVLAIRDGRVALAPRLATVTLGSAAPDFSLEAANGPAVRSADLRGAPALLLFWNQHCGYCQRMLPELEALAAERAVSEPRLLVVSSSDADDHRGWGVNAPVALDPGGRVASTFGAHGTPMAVLIDAEWRIASELATGAQAFFALARGNRATTPGVPAAATAG